MKSKARSTALASAVEIDESSGIRCILLWLSDIVIFFFVTKRCVRKAVIGWDLCSFLLLHFFKFSPKAPCDYK